MPFIGDSGKYRSFLDKIAERKRVISENPKYFESEARSRLTGSDCAVYTEERQGTEYVTVVRSFSHCENGVCKLSNRANHVVIVLDSFKLAGVRVLDLSECSCLTRLIITSMGKFVGGNNESPINIIFNEQYHKELDTRLRFDGANLKFIGLSSIRELRELDIANSHIEGLSALRVPLGGRVRGEVRITNSTGFSQLKLDVSGSEKASVYIRGIDAKEIEIVGSGQGIGKDFNDTTFSVSNCRELTRLTVRGVGLCTLKGLMQSFFELPKMVSFSLYAHMLQFTVGQDERMNVFSLTLGSISLRELVLSAEYTTRGATWLKVGYDKRVNLSIPTALNEFVVPMALTDDCLNLLALTSSYNGLFMAGDKLMLDLENVCNSDIYPILVTSGGKVNFRVPSCVDKIVDLIGYWRIIDLRLILHSGTEVDKSVHEEVVRCD